jgi:HD-like signal output (HDOD) protein/ActR/RegA family two-component response regulator
MTQVTPLPVIVTGSRELSHSKVLIVDDAPENIRLLIEVLSTAGVGQFRATTDPREARRICEYWNPDLVFLDLHMPGMDGVAVIRDLDANTNSGDRSPVLLVTSDNSLESRERALAAGAADVVTKPFHPSDLIARAKRVLKIRAAATGPQFIEADFGPVVSIPRSSTEGLRERALQAAETLPVVASVLQSSLSLFAKGDDLSVAQLAASVEQDVVIAGSVLGIANSAAYGGQKAISSLRQAIARIGLNKTRNVLLGVSVTRSFRKIRLPAGWSLARFNKHSLASAVMSDLIVRSLPSADAEWAFMAGLLHDVGLLVIACGLPAEFEALMAHRGGDLSLAHRERAALGFTHFEIGAEMLARWNCPVAVQEAALFSQRPGFEFIDPLPLGAVVKSATLIADGQSMALFNSDQDRATEGLFDALRIPTPSQFLNEFRSDLKELQHGVC